MTKKFEVIIREDDEEIHQVFYQLNSLKDVIKLLNYDLEEEGKI